MSTAEWGYLKQGDVVVDPNDGRHWQLVSEPEYQYAKAWDKEPSHVQWSIATVDAQGVAVPTTVTMPLHGYVEKVEPPTPRVTGSAGIGGPQPTWTAHREYGTPSEPIHAPDVTAPDYGSPQLCSLCGQPMTVDSGVIHQTLGGDGGRYCVRRSDGVILHGTITTDDPMPADLPDRIIETIQDPEITAQQEAEHAAVVEAWQADGAEIIASETDEETAAREAATMDEPLVLPEINRALELRSHLYLVHDLYVPKLDPGGPSAAAALLEHHRKAHVDGPMKHPHIHQEA